MLIVYRGRSTGVFAQIEPGYDIYCAHGVPTEIPDAIATRLLEQDGWSTPKAGKADAPKE